MDILFCKVTFQVFDLFFTELFIFSVYVLDTIHFSDKCIISLFPHSVPCLFLKLELVSLIFFFMCGTFYALLKIFCLTQGHADIIFCCYLIEALLCYLYVLSPSWNWFFYTCDLSCIYFLYEYLIGPAINLYLKGIVHLWVSLWILYSVLLISLFMLGKYFTVLFPEIIDTWLYKHTTLFFLRLS